MIDSNLLKQLYSSVSPKGFELMIKDLLESIGFDDEEDHQHKFIARS